MGALAHSLKERYSRNTVGCVPRSPCLGMDRSHVCTVSVKAAVFVLCGLTPQPELNVPEVVATFQVRGPEKQQKLGSRQICKEMWKSKRPDLPIYSWDQVWWYPVSVQSSSQSRPSFHWHISHSKGTQRSQPSLNVLSITVRLHLLLIL